MFLLAGCASVSSTYRPQTIGALDEGRGNDGLLLKLGADETLVPIGTPVVFQVLARNVSSHAFWIPLQPQQGFFWTYADGQHDFFVFDRETKRYYAPQECILLQPGQELLLPGLVATHYFDKTGITEFMAELAIARNINPALKPFWSGRAFSNPFGIWIAPMITNKTGLGAKSPAKAQRAVLGSAVQTAAFYKTPIPLAVKGLTR